METYNARLDITTSAICALQSLPPTLHTSGLEAATPEAIKATIHNNSASLATIKQLACNFNSGGLVIPTGSLLYAAAP
jgi:hypothetical protein